MNSQSALHLAASNGETSALDYMLRHLSVDINVNPLDRLGGIAPFISTPAPVIICCCVVQLRCVHVYCYYPF